MVFADNPALIEKCKSGNGKACKDYGNHLYSKKDLIGASKYYSLSCQLKYAAGCFNEAHLEETDLGNPDFAIHKYQDACNFGDKDGCNEFKRLRKLGFKPAPLTKDKKFSVVKTQSKCLENICKSEILNACESGVKGVEKFIKEKHSKYKMNVVCERLVSPEQPSDQHSLLQENFQKSVSFAYRKYCHTAVYGRVVSFKETNKTDPKKIEKWGNQICDDKLYAPDVKELYLRKMR